jgi:predicted dehydrogenase
MVRIGIVGIGFMGMIHYLAAGKAKNASVAAVCSRDSKKLAGDWRSIRGNFGPRGEMMDLSRVARYSSLDDLLADPTIDLVDVCNPTHLHAETAIAALRAGKHVLVEKAIAMTLKEADAMVRAAKKAKKLLMVAHVLPFHSEFAWAAEAAGDGRFGKLLAGHFRRIISRPDWSSEIGDASKTGGPAVDLHVHDTHFIALLCGVPKRVVSSGVVERGTVQHLTTLYHFGKGGPSITCSSGALAMKAREFTHGFELYFEKATLTFELGATPLTVLGADGKANQPKLQGGGDPIAAFTAEIEAAAGGVESGEEPRFLSGQLARDALAMCFREIESVKSGKPVPLR